MKTKPPVGSRVKFISYHQYGDWKRHEGQVARVTGYVNLSYSGFTLEVTWNDGDTSHVPHDNVELAIPMEANV